MGPMAQDFHAIFGLGEDDTHIASLDASGVALAAVVAAPVPAEIDEAAVVAVDGVYSMTGIVPPLDELNEVTREFGGILYVDDAHGTGAIGARGRGTLEYFGMEGRIEFICGTFSKSLASVGGFVASDADTIHYIQHNARALIFSAGSGAWSSHDGH